MKTRRQAGFLCPRERQAKKKRPVGRFGIHLK